jgi:hypothetical protein
MRVRFSAIARNRFHPAPTPEAPRAPQFMATEPPRVTRRSHVQIRPFSMRRRLSGGRRFAYQRQLIRNREVDKGAMHQVIFLILLT